MGTALRSFWHFFLHARISDEFAERFKVRSFSTLGFLARWVYMAIGVWLGYGWISTVSDVPLSRLTLAMLGKCGCGVGLIAVVIYHCVTSKGKVNYEAWGRCTFWGGVILFGIWGWLEKHPI